MRGCDAHCWTPVPCPVCGTGLPPQGRDVGAGTGLAECCAAFQHAKINARHLWTEHDGTRAYTDPEGWAQHVKDCVLCKEETSEGLP